MGAPQPFQVPQTQDACNAVDLQHLRRLLHLRLLHSPGMCSTQAICEVQSRVYLRLRHQGGTTGRVM